ncbi:MAG TPA: hypothetical protein VM370_12955 [Candidatus Thermoplasmatota archaeon]|nr:hypothetical protein [Candidatus Thermoplasmatota archaeon]
MLRTAALIVLLTVLAGLVQAEPISIDPTGGADGEMAAVSVIGDAEACRSSSSSNCIAVTVFGEATSCDSEQILGRGRCVSISVLGNADSCGRNSDFRDDCIAVAGNNATTCSGPEFIQDCRSVAIFGTARSCDEELFTSCRADSVLGHADREETCQVLFGPKFCLMTGDGATCTFATACVARPSEGAAQLCAGRTCVSTLP